MTSFLIYQLKSALLLTVLFVLYRLLISRLTFHRFKRVVLLTVLLLSCCLPAIRITLPERAIQPVSKVDVVRSMPETAVSSGLQPVVPDDGLAGSVAASGSQTVASSNPVTDDVALPAAPRPSGWVPALFGVFASVEEGHVPFSSGWVLALFGVYVLGVAIFLVRKVVSVREIVGIIRDGEYCDRLETCDLIASEKVSQPVSWMHSIVMPRQWLELENQAVWQHESLHARRWHSLDLLFTDLLSAVQWFNPMMRLVHKEMELIHEFEADRAVLDSGASAYDYKMMLVATLAANRGYAMSSWLRESGIKQRIDMMDRKSSAPASRLRGLAIVLAAAFFLIFNAVHAASVARDEAAFEDGRVWIYGDGAAKVRTADGAEASLRTDEVARYLGRYRKVRTTRISLRYVDGVSGLDQVQPLAEDLNRYGIKTAVAFDDAMLEDMVKAAYRRAHVVDLGGGRYRFELNCENREAVQYALSDSMRQALKTLSVTGDLALMNRWIDMFSGHGVAIYPQDMPWTDALSMAETAWHRGLDQVSLVYDDASPAADLHGMNAYHEVIRGENGPRTIALIPQKNRPDARPDETAVQFMSRYIASYTSDWLDRGECIEHPGSQYNANAPFLHVTRVVKTQSETVLLFYSFQYNDLWLNSLTGLSLRAGDKVYRETGHHGLDGFEKTHFWSPDCGFYHFALYYPALPVDVETVDLVDSKNGAVRIRGLQVSPHPALQENTFTMLLYGQYNLKTLNFKEKKPDVVQVQKAVLSDTETTVYMSMLITEPSSFKGHVGSDFTLTMAGGRELKPLRFEGIEPDRDFDREGDDVQTCFQIVFPATTPREWMAGRGVLQGRVCHEPLRIDIMAALSIEGLDEQAIEKLIKAAGLDEPLDTPSEGGSGPVQAQAPEIAGPAHNALAAKLRKTCHADFSVPPSMLSISPTDSIALFTFGVNYHGLPVMPSGPRIRLSDACEVFIDTTSSGPCDMPKGNMFYPGTRYMLNNCDAPWGREFLEDTGIRMNRTEEQEQQLKILRAERRAKVDSLRTLFETVLTDSPLNVRSHADIISITRIPDVSKIRFRVDLTTDLEGGLPVEYVFGTKVTACYAVSIYHRSAASFMSFMLFMDGGSTTVEACLQQLFGYVRFKE